MEDQISKDISMKFKRKPKIKKSIEISTIPVSTPIRIPMASAVAVPYLEPQLKTQAEPSIQCSSFFQFAKNILQFFNSHDFSSLEQLLKTYCDESSQFLAFKNDSGPESKYRKSQKSSSTSATSTYTSSTPASRLIQFFDPTFEQPPMITQTIVNSTVTTITTTTTTTILKPAPSTQSSLSSSSSTSYSYTYRESDLTLVNSGQGPLGILAAMQSFLNASPDSILEPTGPLSLTMPKIKRSSPSSSVSPLPTSLPSSSSLDIPYLPPGNGFEFEEREEGYGEGQGPGIGQGVENNNMDDGFDLDFFFLDSDLTGFGTEEHEIVREENKERGKEFDLSFSPHTPSNQLQPSPPPPLPSPSPPTSPLVPLTCRMSLPISLQGTVLFRPSYSCPDLTRREWEAMHTRKKGGGGEGEGLGEHSNDLPPLSSSSSSSSDSSEISAIPEALSSPLSLHLEGIFEFIFTFSLPPSPPSSSSPSASSTYSPVPQNLRLVRMRQVLSPVLPS